MLKNEDFLSSVSSISENRAEYAILTELYFKCDNKIFLFELTDLCQVKFEYLNIIEFINQNYKSFELGKFVLNQGKLDYHLVQEKSGRSIKDTELFNIAIKISRDNNSYVLVRANQALVLIYKGEFDPEFKNIFADKQALIESNKNKCDINELELVFENFHSERKYRGCDYIARDKVKDTISEQLLRNRLIDFLEKATKLHIVPELCTSKDNDEESVDIGVIDSNNEVAIIEVKYFVKKGLFEDPQKEAYSKSRFRDGYEQLNRYCKHLNKDNYKLHSAFLYMFYAHSDSLELICEAAEQYCKKFINDTTCDEAFKNHYKSTICDNILDIKTKV